MLILKYIYNHIIICKGDDIVGLFYLDVDFDKEDKVLRDHNPYDWVECLVIMPQMRLVTESASDWERGLAYGIMGPMGLVVTSGVNQYYEPVSFKSYFKIAEKGVVILQGCDDGTDLRIPWECIVGSGIQKENDGYYLRITLLKHQTIKLKFQFFWSGNNNIHYIRGLYRLINEKACGVSPEDEGW